jgi:hypothetical protein
VGRRCTRSLIERDRCVDGRSFRAVSPARRHTSHRWGDAGWLAGDILRLPDTHNPSPSSPSAIELGMPSATSPVQSRTLISARPTRYLRTSKHAHTTRVAPCSRRDQPSGRVGPGVEQQHSTAHRTQLPADRTSPLTNLRCLSPQHGTLPASESCEITKKKDDSARGVAER